MFDAFKAAGGHIRLWIYEGLGHDCWTRAYNEPELPRWLLDHANPANPGIEPEPPPLAERLVIPFHPPALKLAPELLDALVGDFGDLAGHPIVTIFRQGSQLFAKDQHSEIAELAAETSSTFFYLNGSSTTRLTFERDAQDHVTTLVLRDDRHEERWEKRTPPSSH
jgi:hypothetical protein